MNDRRTVQLTEKGVLIGDRYEVLLCGSLFYFRLPRAVWHERIEKLKKTGYNCVDVYFPWNYHEREDGTFDFTGEKDISAFLGELRDAGLFVIARPGPYICSEWSGGGLPARILESDMPIRCADERYLKEVERSFCCSLKTSSTFSTVPIRRNIFRGCILPRGDIAQTSPVSAVRGSTTSAARAPMRARRSRGR